MKVQFQVACTAATIDGRVVGVAEHRHRAFLEGENRAELCTTGYIHQKQKRALHHKRGTKVFIKLVFSTNFFNRGNTNVPSRFYPRSARSFHRTCKTRSNRGGLV
jgi:hypothetical protein